MTPVWEERYTKKVSSSSMTVIGWKMDWNKKKMTLLTLDEKTLLMLHKSKIHQWLSCVFFIQSYGIFLYDLWPHRLKIPPVFTFSYHRILYGYKQRNYMFRWYFQMSGFAAEEFSSLFTSYQRWRLESARSFQLFTLGGPTIWALSELPVGFLVFTGLVDGTLTSS